jgi:hypothetical protein
VVGVLALHRGSIGAGLAGLLVVSALTATATAAWAAPPPNDDRGGMVLLQAPATVQGTLAEATLETTNDSSGCANTDGSVWYHFAAPPRGAVVVQLDAAGQMDATVDLFRQVRSRLDSVTCDPTDARGDATLDVEGLEPGADYALRVGNQVGSIADAFTLRVLVPTPPPAPPGRHLPNVGVRNSVDRLLNQGDVYWRWMRAGRTMRLSLRVDQCTSLTVFGPGTRSFSEEPVRRLRCGGYGLFTASRTGRHFLVVQAGRSRGRQPYRLWVARALLDDTTPGLLLRNHTRVAGSVNGGIDTRDLYRFDVRRRSALTLRLSGEPSMTLVTENGRQVGGDLVDQRVAAGRYYVAVQGSGRYVLRLSVRAITRASLRFNGRHAATTRPGSVAQLRMRVRPAVAGRAEATIERLDPIEGWQFLDARRFRVSEGKARLRFRPPSIGRYRAHGSFLGSRNAAPAATRFTYLTVERPLARPSTRPAAQPRPATG